MLASVTISYTLENSGENFRLEILVHASKPYYLITRAQNLNSLFNMIPIAWRQPIITIFSNYQGEDFLIQALHELQGHFTSLLGEMADLALEIPSSS
jgi:hypothetical protein